MPGTLVSSMQYLQYHAAQELVRFGKARDGSRPKLTNLQRNPYVPQLTTLFDVDIIVHSSHHCCEYAVELSVQVGIISND
jgi:hypothetical protein